MTHHAALLATLAEGPAVVASTAMDAVGAAAAAPAAAAAAVVAAPGGGPFDIIAHGFESVLTVSAAMGRRFGWCCPQQQWGCLDTALELMCSSKKNRHCLHMIMRSHSSGGACCPPHVTVHTRTNQECLATKSHQHQVTEYRHLRAQVVQSFNLTAWCVCSKPEDACTAMQTCQASHKYCLLHIQVEAPIHRCLELTIAVSLHASPCMGTHQGMYGHSSCLVPALCGLLSLSVCMCVQLLDTQLEAAGVQYSYGWAIIILTIMVKGATFPLSMKQVRTALCSE